MLGQVQSAFTRKYRHTPAVRAFLEEGNLLSVYRQLDVSLQETYRKYGQESLELEMDAAFVEEVEAYALKNIHDINATLQGLNSGFIRQYVEPLAAHLYREKEFMSRIEDAKECGRSSLYRRLYSSQPMERSVLPPSVSQYPVLSSIDRQTSSHHLNPLPTPSWSNEDTSYIHPNGRGQ